MHNLAITIAATMIAGGLAWKSAAAPILPPGSAAGGLASAAPFSASINRFSSSGVSWGRSIVSVTFLSLPLLGSLAECLGAPVSSSQLFRKSPTALDLMAS
jgi:hypothetical protein